MLLLFVLNNLIKKRKSKMLTVKSLCDQFTKKLAKICDKENAKASACRGLANRLRADASKEDAQAKLHNDEAHAAHKAIQNIEEMFGVKSK